jgi:nitroreductase
MVHVSAHFPDNETIRAALSLATRAPSVHNSQPWRWGVGPHSLHLFADYDRRLPNTDPDNRDLLLSCGASLNHCVVGLAALGWQTKIHRFPDPGDDEHLAAIELQRRTPADVDVALAAAIPRRRTDRRHYSSWPVPLGDIALMGARAARAGVRLRRVEPLTDISNLVAQAARQHATDYEYLSELATWSGRYGSKAGVAARNTPESDATAALPGRVFAGTALAQPPDAGPADDNAIVVALGTSSDDQIACLRAGEAASLVLLTATALGLASCPITEPLEVAQTREAARATIFGAGDYPQILLRVGWAPVNTDPLPSTPRRSMSEVVERLDGSAFD